MKRFLLAGLIACLSPLSAIGAPVTIERSLAQLGLGQGIVLSDGETGSVFVPVPSGVPVRNLRIAVEGRAVAPYIDRGSLVVSVNGTPLDAVRLDGDREATRVALETGLEELAATSSGLDIRFRADLITSAALCSTSPVDSLTILPTTRIAYEVDPATITSLSGALSLLPREVSIALPSGEELSPQVAGAAIEVATMLLARGHDIRFRSQRTDDLVSFAITPESGEGLALVNDGGHLRVVVSADANVGALWQLWQSAPGVLASASHVGAEYGDENPQSSEKATALRQFASLPSALPVKETGELALRFPMIGPGGNLPSQAELLVGVAPDWSGSPPLASFHLNGQLITAVRLDTGRNTVRVPLPPSYLGFDNNLRMVLQRGPETVDCTIRRTGHPVQILAGSGVRYESTRDQGFAAFARRLRHGVTVVVPEGIFGADALPDYLSLTAKILAGLGAVGVPTELAFDAADQSSTPVIRFASTTAEALSLAPDGESDYRFVADAPMASIAVGQDNAALEIEVLNGQAPPDPSNLVLGNASRAIVGNAGVLWEDQVAFADRPFLVQARDSTQVLLNYLRENGFWIAGILAALLVGIVGARAAIRAIYRSRKPR